MIKLMQSGGKWIATGLPKIYEGADLATLIANLFHYRSEYESLFPSVTEDPAQEEQTPMEQTAFSEYVNTISQVNTMAEGIVDAAPRLARLAASNDIEAQLAAMPLGDKVPGTNMNAGRMIELLSAWEAIFTFLNTPMEVYPGVSVTPIEVIYRRGTPAWVASAQDPQPAP